MQPPNDYKSICQFEKDNVYNLVKQYDIVSLNEIKTPLSFSCPGYVSIISRDIENPSRGGTCVLIRNSLSSQVTNVDVSRADQIWLQLKCLPDTLFGFYIYLLMILLIIMNRLLVMYKKNLKKSQHVVVVYL